MLTDLVQAQIPGNDGAPRAYPGECTAFGILLVSAGTEACARLLGVPDSFWRIIRSSGALVEDPSLIPNAVEELLRY